MTKTEIIENIDNDLTLLNTKDFVKLWNNIFEEERIKEDSLSVDQKKDLAELMVEEISFFETEKLIKIHTFIENRV